MHNGCTFFHMLYFYPFDSFNVNHHIIIFFCTFWITRGFYCNYTLVTLYKVTTCNLFGVLSKVKYIFFCNTKGKQVRIKSPELIYEGNWEKHHELTFKVKICVWMFLLCLLCLFEWDVYELYMNVNKARWWYFKKR